MSEALVPQSPLERSQRAMQRYLENTRSPSTLKAYAADCRHFAAWCEANGLDPLPAEPETVALYISDLAGQRSVACVSRRLAAINAMHQLAGCGSPARDDRVRSVLKGIKRTKGVAQRQKQAAVTDVIVAMASACPESLIGMRDKALLLFGFASALRRAEMCGLTIDDIEFIADGVVVTLARSKTDQYGRGQTIGVPYGTVTQTCPVAALRNWLDAARIQDGLLFRSVDRHGNVGGSLSGRAVAQIVKRAAARAGLEGDYSGLSLRAGFATAAAMAGLTPHAIMRQTRHRQARSLDRYVRIAGIFRDNPVSHLGL